MKFVFSVVATVRTFIGLLLGIVLLWLSLAFPCGAEEIGPSSLNQQDLTAFLNESVPELMKQHNVPGIALTVVKDGSVLVSKGYGFADLEQQVPASPEKTLWRVGSLSKLLTTTAVMQLAEQGKLDLNDDVNQYLHDFKIPNTYDQPITLAHLLTHTDGFDFGWGIGILGRSAAQLTPLGDFLKTHLRPRVLPPGEVFFYGDVGIALAGYLVEKTSGVPFAQYVDTNLLRPLGMTRSTFEQPLPSQLASNLAVGYKYQSGSYVARPFAYYKSVPTGAFTTTAADMGKFTIALLQNGRFGKTRILQESTASEMQRQQFTHSPPLAGTAYGFYERSINGERVLEHTGRMNGYNSLLFLLPERKLGFFLAYNNNGGRLIRDLSQAFFDRYYPQDEKVSLASESSESSLEPLEGTYRLNHYSRTTIDKLGVLLGQAPEVTLTANDGSLKLSLAPEVKWFEVEPLLFRAERDSNYMAFREENHRITHLFLGDYVFATFEKLAWYEPIAFQAKVIGGCILVFLSIIVQWLWNVIRRPQQRKDKAAVLRRVVTFYSIFNLVFIIGTALLVTNADFWEILYGLPPALKIMFFLPSISILLLAGLAALLVLAWISRWDTPLNRLHYSIVVLAGAIFTIYLNYWNVLRF